MNLGKTLTDLATAPVRVGLAVADAGLDIANSAVGRARSGSGSVAHMLGIDDAVERANRLARLMDEDQPLGRALAPGGPVDRLLQPDGLVDRLTAPGGVLDRLTEENSGLMRAIEPGGLVDQVLAEDGLLDRLLAEDGVADRLLAVLQKPQVAAGQNADQLAAIKGDRKAADVLEFHQLLGPGDRVVRAERLGIDNYAIGGALDLSHLLGL